MHRDIMCSTTAGDSISASFISRCRCRWKPFKSKTVTLQNIGKHNLCSQRIQCSYYLVKCNLNTFHWFGIDKTHRHNSKWVASTLLCDSLVRQNVGLYVLSQPHGERSVRLWLTTVSLQVLSSRCIGSTWPVLPGCNIKGWVWPPSLPLSPLQQHFSLVHTNQHPTLHIPHIHTLLTLTTHFILLLHLSYYCLLWIDVSKRHF